jgi:hypothetical protein
VVLNSVNIQGLDTLEKIVLLKVVPNSNYSMVGSISLESLDITGSLIVDLSNPGASIASNNVSIHLGIRNITLEFDALMAIDEERVLNCRIGSLVTDVIGCVTEAIQDISVLRFSLTIDELVGPIMNNLVDKGTNQLLNGS